MQKGPLHWTGRPRAASWADPGAAPAGQQGAEDGQANHAAACGWHRSGKGHVLEAATVPQSPARLFPVPLTGLRTKATGCADSKPFN